MHKALNSIMPAGKQQLREKLKAKRAQMPPEAQAVEDAALAGRLFELPEWQRAKLVLTYLSFGDEVDTWEIVRRAWDEGKQVAVPRCETAAPTSSHREGAGPMGVRREDEGQQSAHCEDARQMSWFIIDEPAAADFTCESKTLGESGEPDIRALLCRLETLATSPYGMHEPDPAACKPADLAACAGNDMLAIVPGLAFDREGYRLGYGGGYYDVFLHTFPGASVGLCRTGQLLDSLMAEGAIESHDEPVDKVITQNAATL